MTDQDEAALGLRERKKQALRGELSLAALRLAKERGLENVRTEDIVAAVGVSRRTFSNYFANKYEAIVDRHVERAQLAAVRMRQLPPDEPLWRGLTAVMMEPYEASSDALAATPTEERESLRLVLDDPMLRAELVKGSFAAASALTAAIAERTGTDPDRDLYPALVASVALAAQTTVLDRWLRADPPESLVSLLRDAMAQVAAGLPEPQKENL
ncbi:MAG: TetR family transcriptional regulator [Streptosporangiaceae bacterium]